MAYELAGASIYTPNQSSCNASTSTGVDNWIVFHANRYGGYSGPGIFPIALRMVNQVRKACPDTPIIGCGGISSAEDVIEMLMSGANAVEIGAANLVEPTICAQIIDRLPQLMSELKINHLQDIIGVV